METTGQYPQATRLLRCRKTKRYFSDSGWTEDPAAATPFPDEIEAARTATIHNLHEIDLVLLSSVQGTELFVTPLR